jgi:hypothetical protein
MNKERKKEYEKKQNYYYIWKISLKYSLQLKFNNLNNFDSIYKAFINELKTNNKLNYKHKCINVWKTLENTIKKNNKSNKNLNAYNLFQYINVLNNNV